LLEVYGHVTNNHLFLGRYGAGIISLGSLLDGVTKRFSRDVELEEVLLFAFLVTLGLVQLL